MKKICLYVCGIALFACHPSMAGGRYAGASMELGVGSRPLALAGAAVAMSGNAETFYYNPSSLGLLNRPVLNLMYAPTFGSLYSPMAHYHHIGAAFPLSMGGTVAVNWTRFAVDEIPIYPKLSGGSFTDRKNNVTLRPDGTALGYFEDTEDVYYFSFARLIKTVLPMGWLYVDLPVEIPVGINLKFLRQSLYKNKASGLGVDLGAMFRFSLRTLFDDRRLGLLTLGLSLANISNTTMQWDTKQEDRIHQSVAIGAAYEQPLWKGKSTANLYWTYVNRYAPCHLVALELQVHGLAVRIGKNEMGLTAGAGLRIWHLCTDYAFVINDFDNLHRISCSVFF